MLLLAVSMLALVVGSTPASAATLAEKQAQAADLDREVREIEHKVDKLGERYRGRMAQLQAVQADVEVAREEVIATRSDLQVARVRLATRAGVIYRTRDRSQIVELATAGSIGRFFQRVDMLQRIGDQDTRVLVHVEDLNRTVERRRRALERARATAAKVARQARADEARVQSLLEERNAALAAVNADIRAILEEQRRQAAARAAAAARESAALARLADTAEPAGRSRTDAGASDAPDASSSSDSSESSGVVVPLPPGSSVAAAAASAAMSKLGAPYVWAGSGPDVFDCSGLVMWAFAQAGRSGMPHSTYVYAEMGVDVPLDQLQVGDLVFGNGNGHMGIYVGGGSFVHAPNSGDVVKVTSMSDYSVSHARRI